MVVVADGTIACASRARSIRFRHFGRFGMSAVRAEPFALWLGGQSDALEMEPLDFALLVVATDHLAKRYLDKNYHILVKVQNSYSAAEAISRFVIVLLISRISDSSADSLLGLLLFDIVFVLVNLK